MTDDESGQPVHKSLRVRLTGILMARQVGLLVVIAVLLLLQTFFFNLYGGIIDWTDLWGPRVALREWLVLPAILVGTVVAVLLIGLAFAAGPSEQSFHIFLLIMIGLVGTVHYDHSILDWLLAAGGLSLVHQNPVSAPKLVLGCATFAAIILMHYNILSDDFTRRMLGRGVAAEEVLPVRGHMIRLLIPLLITATAVAGALALVGEFSQLIFENRGLFPKLEIVLLGAIGVAIGVLLLYILRGLYGRRQPETKR